ncbi:MULTISPECIES: alpha-ketoacid dehydrogenase subunit beta [Bombella]|uniref:Transketolase-like pyrimidine-binding domain-containing protein n=1 Tax=Bombella pollinis TaxID=2967337 RepID=A0ABT3WLJ1_9PROT|nr:MULTISPECIES: transketolase C-terminal domain-containing protein [Bombella]MCX5619992.1 hypothetical protein [Bombella pollinis]
MFGGTAEIPLVIRTMVGAGINGAAQHSQMLTSLFTHIPGLKVVCPSTPYDAKGLMIEAIRDKDPVIFCEPKAFYEMTGPVPEAPYTVPFGTAQHVREGRDVSIITYGPMVPRALEAATQLAKAGVEADIMAQVVEKRFSSLKSAPQMVSAPHTPVPFSPLLEEAYIPGATQIVAAVKRAMGHKA